MQASEAFVQQHLQKIGGGSANTNIVQLIKFGGYRQFSVPKPPLLLAANRYRQVLKTTQREQTTNKRTTIIAV